MKRNLWLLIVAATLLLPAARASAPVTLLQESTVPVIVDKHLSGAALVRNGVAYLPLRAVAKYLDLKVEYNADAQLIIIDTPAAKNKTPFPTVQ